MPRSIFILPVVVLAGCSGCTESLPETPAELTQVIIESRDAAEAARKKKDPDAAGDAADRAGEAMKRLDEILAARKSVSKKDKTKRDESYVAARRARYFADLAREEKEHADALASWKATGYRAARTVAWKGALNGLALAADQAEGKDLKTLPESVQESAQLAAELAQQFSGREPKADGQTDWKGVADDLRDLADGAPAQHATFLALALLLAGQKDFALFEIEMVDEAKVPPGESRLYFHLLNAIIDSMHDWQHLAVLEVEKIPEGDRGDSRERLAGAHLAIAFFHLKSKDYKSADREIVRSMQIWPNNPVSVFLTGERLAATGERAKAADSLEDLARDAEGKWFAKRVAERARELRDSKAEGQSLIYDKAFMSEVVLKYVWMSAEKSPAGEQTRLSIDRARDFGKRLVDELPGE